MAKVVNILGLSAGIDLSYLASPIDGTIVNSNGSNAVIPLADSINAGLLSPGDFDKIQLIDDIVTQTITNGDITHAPSADAVFDALALKANDNNVLHRTMAETFTGYKTALNSGAAPSGIIIVNNIDALNPGFQIQNDSAAIGADIFTNGDGDALWLRTMGAGTALTITSSTFGGKPFSYANLGIETTWIEKIGYIHAPKFIKVGGLSTEYLMADGSVSTLSGIASLLIAPTIVDGDTTHAPSGDAVFDALALKVSNIVAGSNITVNSFDPLNPIISAIPSTSAGIFDRVYFTGQVATVATPVGPNYDTLRNGKGSVASVAIVSPSLAASSKVFFARDMIGPAQAINGTLPIGNYSSFLSVLPSSATALKRFTIEIFLCDNTGVIIPQAGPPSTDPNAFYAGKNTVVILDSGDLTLPASNSSVGLTGYLSSVLNVTAGQRFRYHMSVARGATGAAQTMTINVGSTWNSYVEAPVPITTTTVTNLSTVLGATATDALNALNSGKVSGTGSGILGQVAFFTGANSLAGDNGLFWDNTNKRLGLSISNPATKLGVNGSISINSGLTDTSTRPALATGILANGEIRGFSTSTTVDWGFLRISSGGGNNAVSRSYIDLTGASTIPDMDRNITMGIGGVEHFRLISNGNFGFGGPPTSAKVEIVSPGNIPLAIKTGISGGSIILQYKNSAGNQKGYVGFGTDASNNMILANSEIGGNVILLPETTGNVGLNNSTPFTKLTMKGSISIDSDIDNTAVRPAVSAGALANGEIRGFGIAPGSDAGFLRISAGGGTLPAQKSYIDIAGNFADADLNGTIVFGTLGVEKMRIDQFGNTSIGIPTSIAKFSVRSADTPLYAITALITNHIRFDNIHNSAAAGAQSVIALNASSNSGVNNAYATITAIQPTAASNASILTFKTRATGGAMIEGLRIDNLGNIGVNKQNIYSKFDVLGSVAIDSNLSDTSTRPPIAAGILAAGELRGYSQNSTSVSWGFLRISAGGGVNSAARSFIDLAASSSIPDMDRNIIFGTAGTEKVRIDTLGNVTIGTPATTSAKLHVVGPTNSKLIHVESALTPTGGVTMTQGASITTVNIESPTTNPGYALAGYNVNPISALGMLSQVAQSADTGTLPLNIIQGARLSDAGSTAALVVTRPILGISNFTTRLMTVLANGNAGFGIALPTARVHIAASTTLVAAMNLIVGVAPTTPNDGDIWLESNTNTGLKIRIAGVTKTISLV